jgi:DNA repair protein RecO (recombination protein O)
MAGETLTPAFVLHRRRYGDSGLLLELLPLSQGRIPVVARGAASLKSRRCGLLQPFVPLLVNWGGRGAVKTLSRVESNGHGSPLEGKMLFSALYVNELLVRLLPQGDPSPRLFRHYGTTLEALRGQSAALDQVLRRFELRLLDELGYGPDLAHDARGKPIREEGRYHYLHEEGFHAAEPDMAGAFSGATLLALARDEPLQGDCRHQARRLLRILLGFYLGDRPLKSRELFRTMRPDSGIPRKIS